MRVGDNFPGSFVLIDNSFISITNPGIVIITLKDAFEWKRGT